MSQLENMTLREAAAVLRQRIEVHQRAEENARIDRQRDEGALAVIEALMRDNAAAPEVVSESSDRPQLLGIAAVREVMRSNPGHAWSPREVHEMLERHGWLSGRATHAEAGTASAIGRLLAKREIEKVARGRYRWRGTQEEALTED